MESAETRNSASPGCSRWIRLSASVSKVMQTAHLAPFGQGGEFLILAPRLLSPIQCASIGQY